MDSELNERVKCWLLRRDDSDARFLVEALYPLVSRIVRRHVTGRESPEDLAQEVFARFFEKLRLYDQRSPLEHWLARLALNVCRTHWRRQARRPELRWEDLQESERLVAEQAMSTSKPLDGIEDADARLLLMKVLATLPADDRLVLTLLHLEEKSVEEIAMLMGWNRTLVKVRAFRARAKLRKVVTRWEGRNSPPG